MPAGYGVKLFGDWGKAAAILGSLDKRFQAAAKRAMLQEAQFLRGEIVKGIRDQAPGGQPFAPLAKSTLATRKFRGFGGTKALMVRGDLRNSIVVKAVADGQAVFVGVLRSAKGKNGQSLVDVARLMEEGGGPFLVPITPKSSRFYHAAMRKAGISIPSTHGGGGGVAVAIVRIKARPFLAPVFAQHGQPNKVRERFFLRLANLFMGTEG